MDGLPVETSPSALDLHTVADMVSLEGALSTPSGQVLPDCEGAKLPLGDHDPVVLDKDGAAEAADESYFVVAGKRLRLGDG